MASEGRTGPTVSVIIPVFNCAKYVDATIRSCLEQIAPSDEIIVVDDGSDHGPTEVLQGFAVQPSVSVQHQTNRGVSAARNACVRASTGTFVVFLDADEALLPDALHFRRRGLIVSHDFDGGGTRDAVHQALLGTADRLQ